MVNEYSLNLVAVAFAVGNVLVSFGTFVRNYIYEFVSFICFWRCSSMSLASAFGGPPRENYCNFCWCRACEELYVHEANCLAVK